MPALEVNLGPLAGNAGYESTTPAPVSVVDAATANFRSITSRLNGYWLPTSEHPTPIPEKPDQTYYREFALNFAKSYFYKNLLKCIISIEILRHHIDKEATFTDLGAGSGAFSIALMASLGVSEVDLIDYSEAQLSLARGVIKALMYNGRVSMYNMNIGDFYTRKKNCVSSYAIGESMQNNINILQKIESSETFIVLDHPEIVSGIASYLKFRGDHAFGRYVHFQVGGDLLPFIEGGRGRFSFLMKRRTGKVLPSLD